MSGATPLTVGWIALTLKGIRLLPSPPFLTALILSSAYELALLWLSSATTILIALDGFNCSSFANMRWRTRSLVGEGRCHFWGLGDLLSSMRLSGLFDGLMDLEGLLGVGLNDRLLCDGLLETFLEGFSAVIHIVL